MSGRPVPVDLAELALQAAHTGARAIRSVLDAGGLAVSFKAGNHRDPVTAADHASERAIRDLVTRHRPEDGWLAEESGAAPGRSGLRWVVDPLDGTVNLSHGSRQYAVSVAVQSERSGQTIAAAVLQLATRSWLALGPTGVTGSWPRIGVTRPEPTRALLGFAVPNQPAERRAAYHLLAGLAPRVQDLRNHGSSVCDLAAVVAGELDGFVSVNPAPWDLAAGVAMVRAAGGASRDWRGPDGLMVTVAGSSTVVDAVCEWIGS